MITELQTKVTEVIQRTPNVKSFRVAIDDWVDFKAGQFLFVTVDKDKQLTKHLSISSSPTEKGFIEFTKKLTNSEFSQALDNLKPGDWTKIRYPLGHFILDGKHKKIAFLSGGIGITPIRGICRYVVDKKLGTDITLLYGNRTSADIAFKEDFEGMQKVYPGLKVVHVLSRAEDDWQGRRGHIADEIIKEEIPDYAERKFYICGPPAMVDVMKSIITEELDLPEDNVITENFTGY